MREGARSRLSDISPVCREENESENWATNRSGAGRRGRTSMAQNCMKRRRHTEARLIIEESMQSEQIIQAFF